jgi:hypothetical protein
VSIVILDEMNLSEVAEAASQEHICATCSNKERVMVSSASGSQLAVVWRCRELTQRFHKEILVQPTGSCFEAKSVTDFWRESNRTDLVW